MMNFFLPWGLRVGFQIVMSEIAKITKRPKINLKTAPKVIPPFKKV